MNKNALKIHNDTDNKLIERLKNNIVSEENKYLVEKKINALTNEINKRNEIIETELHVDIPKEKYVKKVINTSDDVLQEKKKRNRNFKKKYVNYEKSKIDFQYLNYLKICETIPDYMHKSIQNTPNNKGVIWRGVRLYGEKPKLNNSVVYLDERKSGTMYVHEITKFSQKTYLKNKNRTLGPLVSEEKRIPRVHKGFDTIEKRYDAAWLQR